jgi:hypothetical protein
MTGDSKFVVVENAGYIGECDITSFDTLREAFDYVAANYDDDERDPDSPYCLHVDIRQDWTDDDGTERQEYTY